MEAKSLQELKKKLTGQTRQWADSKIDAMCAGNPKLKVASIYMKRGVHNALIRGDEKISSALDRASLFLFDENGKLDADTLINDMLTAFKEMDEQTVDLWGMPVVAGKGVIKIPIPDNFITSMFFGNTGGFKITLADINDLKDMILGTTSKL